MNQNTTILYWKCSTKNIDSADQTEYTVLSRIVQSWQLRPRGSKIIQLSTIPKLKMG